MMKNLILLIALSGMVACASQSSVVRQQSNQDILTVQSDGTMVLNERIVSEKDVVIYPDGYGGERAAIKVRVPLKPDYYRDTIRVQREDTETDVLPN